MSVVESVTLTSEHHCLGDLARIAFARELRLDEPVRAAIERGAKYVETCISRGDTIYGVTTGFGALSERPVPKELASELQRRHVVSHACGVGPFVEEHIARLVMLIKLLTFRGGHTGITLATVDRLLELWNRGAIPAIPLQGSVGASGDLAPLAHMSLPLLGLGHVHVAGRVVPTREALPDWRPVEFAAKEGLALTNGIQFITAIAAHCAVESQRLAKTADAIAAMSVQAFSAAADFYAARYHETSRHAERGWVALNLRTLLADGNHARLPTAVPSRQDPYSFRCIPQVHGAVRQAVRFASRVIEDEANSVSDNPLFFPDADEVLCGGNLHGESVAMALDFLAIAASELASISERRTYQLLSGRRGLPDFLVRDPGLNSGFMVAQYTSAALVNHNKVLSTPACVDTIPTCQLQEDHVSMGGTSAIKMLQVRDNCERVLAIELLLAAQASSMVDGLRLSPSTAPLLDAFRRRVAPLTEDRVLADDIESARQFVRTEMEPWTKHLV